MKQKTTNPEAEPTMPPIKLINANGSEIYSSIKQASIMTKTPYYVLKAAKNSGCPAFLSSGRVDWAQFVKWYESNKDSLVKNAEETDNSLTKWKTRKTKADAIKAEMELERLKGSYITTEEAAAKVQGIAQAQRATLKQLFTVELPQKLAGLTVPEISVIMETQLNVICDLMKNLKIENK